MDLKITAYSHFFKVTHFTDPVKQSIYLFITQHVARFEIIRDQFGMVSKEMKEIYATSKENRKEFRFHINQLQHFIDFMRGSGHSITSSEVEYVPLPDAAKVEFKLKPGWIPREGQTKALDYIFKDDPLTKMIPLQAGAGKTATTFFSMVEAGVRTLLVIKANLLKQWVDAYKNQLEYNNGDILAIQGRSDLLSLIHLAQAGELNCKFIAISNVTLQRYITDWEQSNGEDDATPVAPDEMFSLLRCGMIVQDEWHLFFHLNFKIDLYTHARHVIKLSATVDPDDAFMRRMYDIAAPSATRFAGVEYNRYVHVVAYAYSIKDMRKIRLSARGRTSYSHKEFEKSLMKNKRQLENYKEMVRYLVEEDYIKVKKPGQKMILFADLVDLCTEFRDHLQPFYPDLKVMRKVSGDPRSVLEEADIICTTLGSMGVGQDVVDLYYVLMTPAVSSRATNEQAKGRLRELKNYPDMKPKFAYLYCVDIKKHIDYHIKKKEDFKGKCLTHMDLMLEHRI